jgi:predicted aspartyl protease
VRRTAAAVFAAILAACGAPPAPKKPDAPHPQIAAASVDAPRRPPLTRRAPLRFELNGRPFPLPLVRGTIGGKETLMLVDTGANSHVIAGWFAKRAALAVTKRGDVGTDHAGKSITTRRVDHPQVTIDQWGPLAEGPMLVTDLPPIIEKLGIGAFVSPQRLTEEGDAVVVDLREGEMRAAWFDEASRGENPTGALLAADDARACEDTASPIKGLAFVVPATIEGVAASLLLDTGAQRSDVLARSPPGKALARKSVASREQMYGASGKLTARTVPAAKVLVGSVPMTLDVDLIGGESDAYCPRDGALSMDVLRACVLVLGRKQLVVRCAPR